MLHRVRTAIPPLLVGLIGLTLASPAPANWAILHDQNGYFARGIPDESFAKLGALAKQGANLTTIAFAPGGGWAILYDRNGFFARGIPDDAFQRIKSLAAEGVKIKTVAFTQDGGWAILYNKNGYHAKGIPDEAFAKLVELAKQGANLKSIAFTHDGGWTVLFDQNGYFARGIPDPAFRRLGRLARQGANLKGITFGPAGGWLILHDKNGYTAEGLPDPAFGRVEQLAKDGVEMKVVSFVPRARARTSADDPAAREEIARRMAAHQVPGLGVAVIKGGRVEWARGYGVLKAGEPAPVTAETRFQAASLSKPVAALAALRLVDRGTLPLDRDLNASLTSWKVPEDARTATEKPTLRRVLSHSAGFSVHGFAGYAAGATAPTLDQILDGRPPANSPPIRVVLVPGSRMQYSGGGYTVLQRLMIDATGRPFPDLMRALVLDPLGMKDSTFEQPLPADLKGRAATGHVDGSPIPGGWRVHPELAAAGLWTTPSDVARFLIALQRARRGDPGAILPAALAGEMLRRQSGDAGLGVFLSGSGPSAWFEHDGSNAGFESGFIASVEGGEGAVVMTNANGGRALVGEILGDLRAEYGWPSP